MIEASTQTLAFSQIADRSRFDVLVVGAGPAGTSCAFSLAKKGYSVVIVDKQLFPRDKVCGSCLSGQAIQSITRLGLNESLNGSIPLTDFQLSVGDKSVNLVCVGGKAISRKTFDNRLVQQASRSGAMFFDGTTANPVSTEDAKFREVELKNGKTVKRFRFRVVLLCTGLGKGLLRPWGLKETVSTRSRIGLSAYYNTPVSAEPGKIYMVVGKEGYVGITAMEDGRLNLSACVNREALRESSPSDLMHSLLRSSQIGQEVAFDQLEWTGTPPLTRRLNAPSGYRFFVLGDASGYLEPFTGQGMAWAFQATEEFMGLSDQAINQWNHALANTWNKLTRRRRSRQQRVCKVLKELIRRPYLVSTTVRVLRRFPGIASPFIKRIHNN